MPERSALRRRYRALRRGLSQPAQRLHAERIRRRFMASPLLWRARRIAAYLSIDGEPDLRPLLRQLHGLGKTLALPVVEDGSRMSFFAQHPKAQLVVNRFGIEEPAPQAPWVNPLALDLVLMPLVAFDGQGGRLGMGGGFYDRRFGPLPPGLRPLLVGIAHAIQQCDGLPVAPWDLPLDGVLTESGWRVFSRRMGIPADGSPALPPPTALRHSHTAINKWNASPKIRT